MPPPQHSASRPPLSRGRASATSAAFGSVSGSVSNQNPGFGRAGACTEPRGCSPPLRRARGHRAAFPGLTFAVRCARLRLRRRIVPPRVARAPGLPRVANRPPGDGRLHRRRSPNSCLRFSRIRAARGVPCRATPSPLADASRSGRAPLLHAYALVPRSRLADFPVPAIMPDPCGWRGSSIRQWTFALTQSAIGESPRVSSPRPPRPPRPRPPSLSAPPRRVRHCRASACRPRPPAAAGALGDKRRLRFFPTSRVAREDASRRPTCRQHVRARAGTATAATPLR